MIFDSVTFQSPLAENSLSQSESYAEIVPCVTSKKITPTQETSNEFFDDTKIQNCENESGAHAYAFGRVSSDSNLNTISYFTAHLESAARLMDAGEYEAEYTELEAAANRFISYKEKINKSVDSSIAYLSTIGCRATPPHPVTLPLVRLRRKPTA